MTMRVLLLIASLVLATLANARAGDELVAQAATCEQPYADARVVNAVSPVYPDSARDLGLGAVTVLVNVTVNPDGTVNAAVISKSSGNMATDGAALRAVRASTFAPKIVDCAAALGDVVFRADFVPSSAGLAPMELAAPVCDEHYDEATLRKEIQPVYPASARAAGFGSAIALVHVNVAPNGAARWVSLSKSTGNAAMDQAALDAAQKSSYNPKIVECAPAYGEFIFRAEFNP